MEAEEYELYGLEKDVNTPHELAVARNMALLLNTLDQMQLSIKGDQAIEQFEDFFRRQSET